MRKTSAQLALYIASVAVIAFSLYVRLRLLGLPLERDEGEYAYAAQLILDGHAPYGLIYNMKFPGIYLFYAAIIGLFGQSTAAIHTGLIITNLASTAILFFLVKRFFGPVCAAVSAAVFAYLSILPNTLGITANAEHFVLLTALAGIILAVKYTDTKKPAHMALSGLLLGSSVMIKQHGVVFLVFTLLYLFIRLRKTCSTPVIAALRSTGILAAFSVIPFFLSLVWLYLSGTLSGFFYWTFVYASEYATSVSVEAGKYLAIKNYGALFSDAPLLWLLVLLGVLTPIVSRDYRKHYFFLYGLFFFSLLSTAIGLYFRPHYLILVLPAASIFAGLAISWLASLVEERKLVRFTPALAIFVFAAQSIYANADYLIHMGPVEVSRSLYGSNPFPESIDIAEYIEELSDQSDKVLVLGSEPQIPFYAKRKSATSYPYMYPMYEGHPRAFHMQKEFISQAEKSRPEYIVLIRHPASWINFGTPGSKHDKIEEWLYDYLVDFVPIMKIEVFEDEVVYTKGEDARLRPPQSPVYFVVFERT